VADQRSNPEDGSKEFSNGENLKRRGDESLEPISKMSFGPISLLVPRLKSLTNNSTPAVFNPYGL
jgi:hypothetical protein